MHVQYEGIYIVQIVVLGCVFGWLRWRSGSTILTMILHAIVNAAALAQVAFRGRAVANLALAFSVSK